MAELAASDSTAVFRRSKRSTCLMWGDLNVISALSKGRLLHGFVNVRFRPLACHSASTFK